MKKINNIIGILRLYSLVDLILVLIVIKSSVCEIFGAVLLHIAFLAYLEYKHSHEYRIKVPFLWTPLFGISGLILYSHIEGFGYWLTSYLYTKKTKSLGWFSPIARGVQNFFIVAGIIGYNSYLTFFIPFLFFIRNLMGDFRDVEKDKKEGMKTIPVLLGFNKSIKGIHLIATLFTSTIWVYLGGISILWLIPIYLIEIKTYNWTPR